ncbi:A/G-specific adenine glycosylase [Candidatus Peregrinibacteria bacterium]|nr:A/G-specific adenine glycosylase [Candidatus Peregrinibacteria bacterium]
MSEFLNLRKDLLTWYKKNKRDLPWRKTSDPYKIWVSEIMLQQTQVSRVLDYYERFLKRFPNIYNLANANWEEFLPYWQGLGFYSRGKNMLRSAKMLVERHHGKFPKSKLLLINLPGVAEYTSAAILSFAFGKAVPAIDTNLRRVFQRVYGCTEKGVIPRANALFLHESANLIRADVPVGATVRSRFQRQYGSSPSHLNHAFMDLGAMICKSRTPECEICPLQNYCHFFQSGKRGDFTKKLLSLPRKKILSAKIPMEVAVACIHQNGKYLIAKRQKRKGGRWEFPGGKRERGEDWRHCLKREIEEELGIEISVRPYFFETVWEEKEFFWRLRFFRCQILKGIPKCIEHEKIQWISPSDFKKYTFPSGNAKAIERLQKMRMT